jgi:phospholipase/carboxylesterase
LRQFFIQKGLFVTDSIIIQQPTGPAQQLMVLHHGVGGSAQHMVGVGQHLAAQFPHAFIVSVQAPDASDLGTGAQWFSVQGISEENRPARIAQAMPAFLKDLRHCQAVSQVGPEATLLLGFSQGAIMSLEAVQAEPQVAARVVSLSGRYGTLPALAPERTTLHMIHGKSDAVIHYGYCVTAAEHLISLGGDVTADVIPFLGHEVNDEVLTLLTERLVSHLPKHQWAEVMKAAPQS